MRSVNFLPQFVHGHIQGYETTAANLVIVRFIFTVLLNMTRCCPVILHVLQGICSCVVFHELLCNFCKCGRFLAQICTHTHLSIWNSGSKFGKDNNDCPLTPGPYPLVVFHMLRSTNLGPLDLSM